MAHEIMLGGLTVKDDTGEKKLDGFMVEGEGQPIPGPPGPPGEDGGYYRMEYSIDGNVLTVTFTPSKPNMEAIPAQKIILPSTGGSAYVLPQASKDALGGIKADNRNPLIHTVPAFIDPLTGKLYVKRGGTTFTPILSPVSGGYELSWNNDGNEENPVPVRLLNGKDGQNGKPGKDAPTPAISIGKVETLSPTEQATAELVGPITNLLLNLGIPQGKDGAGGGGGEKPWKLHKSKTITTRNDFITFTLPDVDEVLVLFEGVFATSGSAMIFSVNTPPYYSYVKNIISGSVKKDTYPSKGYIHAKKELSKFYIGAGSSVNSGMNYGSLGDSTPRMVNMDSAETLKSITIAMDAYGANKLTAGTFECYIRE